MEKVTKEIYAAAMQCKSADELIELAKSKGFDITQEEAEAYLEQFSSYELSDEQLEGISGGSWKSYENYKERTKKCGKPHIKRLFTCPSYV